MSPADEQATPDISRLARSMLMLHGGHDDTGADRHGDSSGSGHRSRATMPDFGADPAHAAAMKQATQRDRDRYLTSGLQPVDCRFCHVTVSVKKLGPGYTAVQWNTEASSRCAYFTELRSAGGDSARSRGCPKLTDSINHAIAEGCLDSVSGAPAPDDG